MREWVVNTEWLMKKNDVIFVKIRKFSNLKRTTIKKKWNMANDWRCVFNKFWKPTEMDLFIIQYCI